MSIRHTPSDGSSVRWLKVAATVWLTLVSALAVVSSVGLLRLAKPSHASAQDAHVQALATRVGEVEQQTSALRQQPTPITQPDLDAARQALEERLSRVEQAQATDSYAANLEALRARVGEIEARTKKAPPAAAMPRRAVEAAKPQVPAPPFHVIGVELRGGERFLSIAVTGTTSLHELRLLREGDDIGFWHLQAIEARAAVFRLDDQTLRIALP